MDYSKNNGDTISNISVNGQDEDTINLSLEDGDKDEEEEEDEDLSHLCNESIDTLDEDVQLTEDFFGYSDPSLVAITVPTKRFTWITKNKLVVQLITYGATITSIEAPDRHGQTVDVVLGFNEIEGYTKNHQYSFGSTIGRVVNVIEDSSFAIRSKIYVLSSNQKDHHYNGGKHGFDKVNWEWHIEDKKVTLSYLSPEGHEGYPGSLLTQITYTVTVDNTIVILMKSTATEPTPVNISNNIYFNLAGHNAGACELYNHFATINADKYTPVTDDQIPTGEKLPVGGTLFDFRIPKVLSDVIPLMSGNGYNSNFCLTKGVEQELSFASRFLHSKSGRVLEVYSDQPGLQFDTANHLPDPDAVCEGSQIKITPPIIGKSGASYTKHGGFCLKSQAFPNAVNQKRFPKVILRPGNEYTHKIVMKFGLQLGKYL